MTIASEVQRIKTNIANAYTSCNSKGATMPASQVSDNLATCIGSIPSGSTPTGTLSITQNGTYDVTNYASADVNVSGGGGSPLPVYSHPELKSKNCYLLSDGTVIPMTFTSVTVSGQSHHNISLLKTDLGIIYLDYPIGSNIGDWTYKYTTAPPVNFMVIKNVRWTDNSPLNPDDIVHISFNCDGLSGNSQFSNCFNGLNNLESISISNMENLKISGAVFKNCRSLEEVDVSSVNKLMSYAFFTTAGQGSFLRGTAVTELSFYSLNSNSFGEYTNQFDNMLAQMSNFTVHFPSNLQSVIGSWSSVQAGFGGTNTTILFDLPATY